jgi:hypothetical protein
MRSVDGLSGVFRMVVSICFFGMKGRTDICNIPAEIMTQQQCSNHLKSGEIVQYFFEQFPEYCVSVFSEPDKLFHDKQTLQDIVSY